MVVVIIIIVIVLIIVLSNLGSNRANQATLNPNTTKQTYSKNPGLKETFLELAQGNVDAIQVLERLANLGVKSNEVITNLLGMDITGYKITLAARSVGNDMMVLTAHLSSPQKLIVLMRKIEEMKALALPAKDEQAVKMILNQHGISSIDQLVAPPWNIKAIKAALDWNQFYRKWKPSENLTRAIFDFLVPDKVDCAQWFVNLYSVNDGSFYSEFKSELTGIMQRVCDGTFMGYPNWFLAGYPQVVIWLNDGDDKVLLHPSTRKYIEEELETVATGEKLSNVALRLIIQDYNNRQKEQTATTTKHQLPLKPSPSHNHRNLDFSFQSLGSINFGYTPFQETIDVLGKPTSMKDAKNYIRVLYDSGLTLNVYKDISI